MVITNLLANYIFIAGARIAPGASATILDATYNSNDVIAEQINAADAANNISVASPPSGYPRDVSDWWLSGGGGSFSGSAEDVDVTDTDDNYTGTNVEDVLDEIASFLGGGGLWDGYAYLREEQAQNTSSGTFTSGAWQERTINTTVFDSDSVVTSLSGNEWTLPAGTYYMIGWAPSYLASRNSARFFNVSDSTVAGNGQAAFSAAGDNGSSNAIVMARVSIAAPKTFRLEHRTDTTSATRGFGVESNLPSTPEIFSMVLIFREVTGNGGIPGEAADRPIQVAVSDVNTVPAIGDGAAHFVVPPAYNGFVVKDGDAAVTTASTSGTVDVAVRRERSGSAVDIFSTKITIDANEKTSYTAATPSVINVANDDLQTGDIVYIDVDAIGTNPKGLTVVLTVGISA